MQTFQGSKKGVRSVAFSPDGCSLAAGGYDGALRLWNLSTGEATRLGSFSATPKSLNWMPDGQQLVWSCSSGDYGSVYGTTIAGKTERLFGGWGLGTGAVCLSPDGQTLFAATERAIRRRDNATGKKFPPWKAISPGFLAVSPDGQTLASTHPLSPLAKVDEFHVALWDTATGTQTLRLVAERAEFYDGVAFSPDGTRLAVVCHESISLWAFPSCELVKRHTSKKFYTGLAFSPDSHVLATSGNDGMVRLWDAATGEAIKAYDWGFAKVLSVAFSPDGTRAAASSAEGRITVWDVD